MGAIATETALKLGEWDPALPDMDDVAFAREIDWKGKLHRRADRLEAEGRVTNFVDEWKQQATLFTQLKPFRTELLNMACWGNGKSGEFAGLLPKVLKQLSRGGKSISVKGIESLSLKRDAFESPTDERACWNEVVAANYLLAAVGSKLETEALWHLLRLNLTWACWTTSHADLVFSATTATTRMQTRCELPLLWSQLFATVKGAHAVRKAAVKQFRVELDELIDNDGTPKAEIVPELGPWLASLIRTASLMQWCDIELPRQATDLFDELIKQAALFLQPGGRLMLDDNSNSQACDDLFAQALKLVAWPKKEPARFLLNGRAFETAKSNGAVLPKKSGIDTHIPSSQSDWSQTAILRSSLARDADCLIVTHHESHPRLELSTAGRTILRGDWRTKLSLDGTPVEFSENWSCSCWYSDADGDYIELQQEFQPDCYLDRFVYLSRHDSFALFADSVRLPERRSIKYAVSLPLVGDWNVKTLDASRAWAGKVDRQKVYCLPLSLPESAIDRANGRFDIDQTEGELKYALDVEQTSVFAPFWLGWGHPKEPLDWRRLTVTEDGRVLGAEVAAGCRVRVGKRQWMLYHSLRESDSARALMGLHTRHETVLSSFEKGDFKPLVQVEAGEADDSSGE